MRVFQHNQPKYDIHTRCGESAAASAKGFPKADLQVCSVDPDNAAPGFKVSEAQIAPFRIRAGVKCIGPPAIGTLVSMEVPTIVCPSLLRVWLYVY